MIQGFISFCSIILFSTFAMVLGWQKLWQNHAIGDGKSTAPFFNNSRRNMLMKAIAIFYFKSQVKTLLQIYREEEYLRLEYDSLVYKITDFRLEVQVPDFTRKQSVYLPTSAPEKRRIGHLMLEDGKRIRIEFAFTSPACDAIVVTDSPFAPDFWHKQQIDRGFELSPLNAWWPVEQLSPQNAEECRVFQRIFRYLLDVNDMRKQKYLTISKAEYEIS